MSNTKRPETLHDAELETVQGGLLLPAVQQAREAARKTSDSKLIGETEKNLTIATDSPDGGSFASTAGGSPNV